MKSTLEILQPLGRALMLPIAVLPLAGLLLRLGQPDLLDIAVLSAAGGAIFDHLGLLFAIGVATGFARDGNGAACLAGITCYLVTIEGAKPLMAVPPAILRDVAAPMIDLAAAAWKAKAIGRLDVPIGIISGLIGGTFYNRFATIAFPEYLAFFGGRRFVPIISGVAGIGLALVFGPGLGVIGGAIDALSYAITEAGGMGLFIFGVLNRLLLVTGLHHLLNNVAWFVAGDYHGTSGDLRRFFAGDPDAGIFMAGFFPVMMFGLPAACLAMYHSAARDQRKAVGGMLLSLALTSALTGVTEPIEFSFMFLAPALYAAHAILTGLSMALMYALGVKLGFGFSAGLFDYVLNYGKATRPLLLLPVGLGYFALYYFLFRTVIIRFNLPTPGRDGQVPVQPMAVEGSRGAAFVAALGGAGNIKTVDACTTRLRLILVDHKAVDEAGLKALGARGVIRPSAHALQVVLGPIADAVAIDVRNAIAVGEQQRPDQATTAHCVILTAAANAALGGANNVVQVSGHGNRVRVIVGDMAPVSFAAVAQLGVRATAHPGGNLLHLLLAPDGPQDVVVTTEASVRAGAF